MPAPTGAHTTLWYYWELTDDAIDFGVGDDTEDDEPKPFGGNATLTQFEGSNNAVDIFEPNSREIAQLIAQHFDGSFSVDFEWTNPWWLQAVISEATETVDNEDGTYTHKFEGNIPLPMTIYAGFEERAVGGSDEPGYRVLEGCVIESATIDVTTEQTVDVSLTGAYVNEEWKEVDDSFDQPSLAEDVLTFAEAALELDESTLSLLQDVSVEINNNTDIIREIGTRLGVDYSPKARIPSVDYTKIREDNDEVESMYGSEAATAVKQSVEEDGPMTFEVDNREAAGAGMNMVQLDMDGAFPESLSVSNLGNPQEDLQEDINRRLRTITGSATNEVEEPL